MKHDLKNNVQQNTLFFESRGEGYQRIRNFLAGRFVGATRDEVLLEEVIKSLFCKVHLRQNSYAGDGAAQDGTTLARRYREAFAEVRSALPTVFDKHEELLLDPVSLEFVDRALDEVGLDGWENDPFGDAYETFIGTGIRGQEGQFFTPQSAVNLLVSVTDPRPGERIIDPACGAGGFLSAAARYLMQAGASSDEVVESIYGVDKDRYLAHLAAAHLSLFTLADSQVFCADSLAWSSDGDFPSEDQLGTFDVVLANPPFGSRIVSASKDVQASLDLGYKWKYDRGSDEFAKQAILQSTVPPQVLFIERCLSLVRPGGRIGMVVPESLLSSRNYRHVVRYVRSRARVRAVFGMPEALFKTSGRGGTHTKTCLLYLEKNPAEQRRNGVDTRTFMAEAKWCGNDSRGRRIDRNELPTIADNFRAYAENGSLGDDHLAYDVGEDDIVEDVLAPRYYDPEVAGEISALEETHDLVKFGDLVDSGLIEVKTGDEIGKMAYGTGDIPFVRTSDISNWEVKLDPKHCVSEDIYDGLARKQDVREGDILMVRDGTYLIGTCALLTNYDTRIVYQSHLYKIRVNDDAKLSPHLLLASLSSEPVRRQIKAKRFTQDIIDSLGNRIYELVLPLPKDEATKVRISRTVKQAIAQRVEARELARKASLEIVGKPIPESDKLARLSTEEVPQI